MSLPLEVQYEKASMLIIDAHMGQRYGDKPYTHHLRMTENKALELFGESLVYWEDQMMLSICCLLHDTLEDTDETKESLLKRGFDPFIVDSVVTVTKKDGQGYNDYLTECAHHWLSFYTKVADSYCNLTESLKSDDMKRVRKYSAQIEKLYKKRATVENLPEVI